MSRHYLPVGRHLRGGIKKVNVEQNLDHTSTVCRYNKKIEKEQ